MSLSGAKHVEEFAGDIHFYVAPQKKEQNLTDREISQFFFPHRKMKHQESSETRFRKVWQLYELCSRDKRAFEVSKKIEIREKFREGLLILKFRLPRRSNSCYWVECLGCTVLVETYTSMTWQVRWPIRWRLHT